MCQRIECRTCKKPGFAGCGMHIEQVLGNVPRDQRCRCAEGKSEPQDHTPSLWKRLVGS